MISKTADTARPIPFSDVGPERTQAMVALQKELLETYEQATAPGLIA